MPAYNSLSKYFILSIFFAIVQLYFRYLEIGRYFRIYDPNVISYNSDVTTLIFLSILYIDQKSRNNICDVVLYY
jgi:hypothetical protein